MLHNPKEVENDMEKFGDEEKKSRRVRDAHWEGVNIRQAKQATSRNTLILLGKRRMGRSSALRALPKSRLPMAQLNIHFSSSSAYSSTAQPVSLAFLHHGRE